MSTGRNTTVRDRHRRIIQGRREPCGICGQEIDYTLITPHPDSFEVDHIIALDGGGEDGIENKQASHRRCNRAKSNHAAPPEPALAVEVTTWRKWWVGG